MKLIRLTDDRYVIDCGPEARASEIQRVGQYWTEWWKTHTGDPMAFCIGGMPEELEYEDRRDPDAIQMTRIEEKLDRIWEALS